MKRKAKLKCNPVKGSKKKVPPFVVDDKTEKALAPYMFSAKDLSFEEYKPAKVKLNPRIIVLTLFFLFIIAGMFNPVFTWLSVLAFIGWAVLMEMKLEEKQ